MSIECRMDVGSTTGGAVTNLRMDFEMQREIRNGFSMSLNALSIFVVTGEELHRGHCTATDCRSHMTS